MYYISVHYPHGIEQTFDLRLERAIETLRSYEEEGLQAELHLDDREEQPREYQRELNALEGGY